MHKTIISIDQTAKNGGENFLKMAEDGREEVYARVHKALA
jgi:hypothetical protein